MGSNKSQNKECPCLPALLAEKYLDIEQNIFVVIDSDQKVSMINRKGCELLGYSKEEIIGKDWCDNFLPKRIIEPTREVLKKVMAGELEETEYHENPILTRNGEERLIAWHNAYLHDESGSIISAISSGEDITERRKAETRLAQILDFLPDATFAIDLEGRIILWNKAIEQMTGRNAKEMLGKGNHEYAVPFYGKRRPGIAGLILKPDKRIERTYSQFQRSGDTLAIEVHIPDMRGKEVFLWATAKPLYDEKGLMVGVIESIRDITKSKKAEMRLKESEERYSTTVQQTNALVYDYNVLTGDIIWAGNIKGLTGFSDSEFSGTTISRWEKMIHPADRAQALEALNEAEKWKKRYLVHYRFLKKSGKYFWAQDVGVFLYDKKGIAYRMLGVMRDVSPLLEAQEALKSSEENHRTLVNQLTEGLIVAQGPKPKIVFANPALSKILGYTNEELLAMPPQKVMALVHPEDRKMFFERFNARLQGKKVPSSYEFRGVRKDRRKIWLSISSNRITYRGQPSIQAAFTDITEQKNALEALQDSEKKYRTLTENMNDVIYSINKAGVITYISPSVRQYGFSQAKMLCRHFTEFVLPDDMGKVMENFKRSIETGREFSTMFRVRTKDGGILWIEDNGKLQYEDSGAVAGITGTLRDITERKAAEDQLKESEEKFRKIIESSHDLVMLTRPDGVIDYLSPACWKVLGWKPQDLAGKKVSVTHPEDRERVWASLSKAMEGESGTGLEYRVITKSGSVRWVSHAWSPIMVGGKLHLIASVVQDITGRRKSQEKLINQKEQIAQLSKMKERFMADMTHELKTPLSVIMLNLEMARKLNPATQRKELDSCFDLMWRNSKRLSRSVEQIMQLTKAASVDLAPSRFHLTDVISEVCDEYLPLARMKGIRVEIEGPDIEMRGNKHFLAMAVSNLVSNAIKFTPHGHVSINWEPAGYNVIISVSDTGVGIMPGNFEKVFHKFFKEDHDSPGSGIGLAISADVIARMGGRMEFESIRGKGSTFRIILPKEVSK